MLVLKVITIFCGFVGCLSGPSTPNDEHHCECDAVKEELGSLKERLYKLETQNKRQSDDNIKSETVSERFVAEIDVEQEIEALKQAVASLQKSNGAGTGGTYVRWGRTVCPTSAEIVYKGYTGGNYYSHTGGPGNHMCLPDDPTWAKYLDGAQDHASSIYGAECEDNYGNTYQQFHKHVDDEDVPCVVCRTNKTTNIMIPARTNCYSGWTLDYTGYLMASATAYSASSEYICVDGDPEFLQHGHASEDGTLLYMVEARCGSLPCGPYVEGRELACVVCSK